jgi:lipopolysaccharide biosynthesis protein
VPLFRGHYQPRIPGELGFYDLRSVEVLREQLSLARQYGLSGFCFYYYYFQGRKLLYQPIANYLTSDLDAPFFLLWANENWSKRWDGGDREVIIEQKHSKADDLAFIRELVPLFQDHRYVKIAGKPLLLIYKPHLFPAILNTTEIWREEVEQYGFPGLYLVMADDWFATQFHPRQYGFDASYEIPSNLVPEQVLSTELDTLDLQEGFTGHIVDYPKFASFHLGRPFPEYKRFRTVMLPWDNTARYGLRAIVHINGQGDAYKLWLMQALLDTYRRYDPDERIVFLHSWNEWCEGTYLEPDGKFGRMFLEQTSEAIRIVRQAIDLMGATPESVAVMAELLRVMQAKDEGAFRVMQVTRPQTAYVWRELEQTRNEVAHLQEALANNMQGVAALRESLSKSVHAEKLARTVYDMVYASRSWRITKPLRTIAARLHGRH